MPNVKKRGKNKDNNRRAKKKVSVLTSEKLDYVDWKDANLVRRFVSERSKIRARRVTGNSAQQQKLCADAVKVAREMALVPYATRVTSQRGGRGDRGDRGDRGSRAEGPAPRPSAPPPVRDGDEGDNGEVEGEIDNAAAVAEIEGVEFTSADSTEASES